MPPPRRSPTVATSNSVLSARTDDKEAIRFVYHESFAEANAAETYGATTTAAAIEQFNATHMEDEDTREHARRMHYAAWRVSQAPNKAAARRWRQRYFTLRDQIVLGNRKLVFRAVRKWTALAHRSDDMIGECYIVLIRAVAVYNPWMGVRFSTYAYTCLVRALSRLSQRFASDWLARSVPLETLVSEEPDDPDRDEPPSERLQRLDEYLHDDHPLLSPREKTILLRRFCPADPSGSQTLEKVGQDLGLSKERVRQVQATALNKLREALVVEPAPV